MKAVRCRAYGLDGVRVEEVEPPVPKADEVLVEVRAAGVNALDWHLLRGSPPFFRLFFGLRRPRDPRAGRDVAGIVAAAGEGATRFRPGDEVFGSCAGAFAQLACAPETKLTAKPANVGFEPAAAATVAGLTALQGLRDAGRLRAGERVLVRGAGGGVGSFAVTIAKLLGAEVTAATRPESLERMRTLGADHVIDRTREEVTAGARRYHLVFDCHQDRPLAECARILEPGGRWVGAGGPVDSLAALLGGAVARTLRPRTGGRRFVSFLCRSNAGDLARLAAWLGDGTLAPSVERSYRLEETAEAIGHLAEGRARGKLVIVPHAS
jgi:NADPH:quinone reductase-like Zn-dependent oxidoreductase